MGKYDDIINLPHHQSQNHPQMSVYNRSAQFAPFAALTGFEDAILEVARTTEERIVLSQDKQSEIEHVLKEINKVIKNHPLIEVKYFVKDKKKAGGKYMTYKGNIKKIDLLEKQLIFVSKKNIFLRDIVDINFADIK